MFSIKEAKELLKHLFKIRLPVLLNGPTGVGKTSILSEISKEEGYNLIDIRLARELPEGIGGVPFLDEKEQVFTKFLHKRLKSSIDKKSIVFFDEFNRSHIWQRNAVMSLFYERRLEDFELHPESVVVLAVNLGKNYQVDEIDEAVLARCAILNIDYDKESFIDFSVNNYNNSFTYLAEKIDEIFQKIPTSQFKTLEPARSTRNLEFVYQILDYCDAHNIDEKTKKKLLSTVVPRDILSLINLQVNFELIKKIISGEWRKDKKIFEKAEADIFGIMNVLRYRKYNTVDEVKNVVEFCYQFYNSKQLKDQFVIFITLLNKINTQLLASYLASLPSDSEIMKLILDSISDSIKYI